MKRIIEAFFSAFFFVEGVIGFKYIFAYNDIFASDELLKHILIGIIVISFTAGLLALKDFWKE